MSVIELETAFERMSANEQEQFAEWYEERLARGGFMASNEAVWADEVDRRLDEIRSGKVQAIPGEQVMAELRRRYGS
jgi:putative addiction module component (TIGR02574 family)